MELFPHQVKALNDTQKYNRCAYYLDMGLGKTFVGSEKLKQLNGKINLVVCQKSKIADWVEHFQTHYEFSVWDLSNKKSFDDFIIKAKTILNGEKFPNLIGIINYDLVFRRDVLLKIPFDTLMLDESSIIQNETAKRSKFVLKMKPKNVILLSGTPTSGKYERLWSQLRLLGWNISKKLYYNQYVEMDWIEDKESGFKIPKVVGYKNVDRLKYKLAKHGAIFQKSEEVFDLPKQQMITVKTSVPKEYKKFMRDEIITIDGHEFIGDTVLTKRIYARMICGYLNRARIEAFRNLVSSTEDRLIVFYNYDEEVNRLLRVVNDMERPFSIVNGHVKDLMSYNEKNDSITFIQYQAGAMGLNLQKANKIIYFSLTDRSELYEQSKKRIHRIGQDRPCFYYLMMCPGTVEEDILHTLEMRKDYTDELFKKYQENFNR